MNLELLKNHPYISQDIKGEKFNLPYNHIIIDNFLKEDIYKSMCELFPKYISKQKQQVGKVSETASTDYNAFIYQPKEEECVNGYDFFHSEIWKDFMADCFKVILNQHNMLSLHFHKGSAENPSKSGWSHKDLALCSVIDDSEKKIKLAGFDCRYNDDSQDQQPNTTKVARQIAILFYFNNKENLEEGDGGGTGVFGSYDKNSLIKEVKPVNNRLFAFEVCPTSFHGFIGGKFDRSAIVQWFHSSPAYFFNRHIKKMSTEYFERWSKDTIWNIEKDPQYFNYFSSSLEKIKKECPLNKNPMQDKLDEYLK